MVDIETTGTSPDHAAIIQIAAVKFDLETRSVDSENMFNRSLALLPKRYWEEDTRQWWSRQKAEVLRGIYSTMEPPHVVMQDFADWAGYNHSQPLRFWAKPTTFDFSFIQSYFKQLEIMNPFHFRYAIDLNSFIRGLNRASHELPDVQVPFVGDAHNALFDVIHQIQVLFQAVDEVGK